MRVIRRIIVVLLLAVLFAAAVSLSSLESEGALNTAMLPAAPDAASRPKAAEQRLANAAAPAPASAVATAPAVSQQPAPAVSQQPAPASEPQYVSLLFAGDVMAHQKQLDCHRFGSLHDFTGDYTYIRDTVMAADIAVANLETPMTGEKPYTGYPNFNAPDSLADALLYAGFDVIATANNHIRDQKDDAMKRTCAFLGSKGFAVIGTAAAEGGSKYALIEKNGIRVGLVNFTKSLNRGFPDAAEPYVNCLKHEDKPDRGFELLEEEITALKAQGAEFIVVFVHWGSEYELEGNAVQQGIAGRIADMGAGLIVGAHPHVLQNVAEYTSPVTGRSVLIYYSLGNLVSNQPYGYGPGGGHCETGALALIRLKRQEDGSVAIDEAGYLTTYVHKPEIVKEYTQDGEVRAKSTRGYMIVPAAAVLADPAACEGAAGRLLEHIGQGFKNGEKVLGESGRELALFNFKGYEAFPW